MKQLLRSIAIISLLTGAYFTWAGITSHASRIQDAKISTSDVLEMPMTCKSNVQLSLGGAGFAVLEPQMLLAGNHGDYSIFEVTITDPPLGHDTASCELVGEEIMVEVFNTVTQNKCWSNVFVEDKLAPVLVCDTIDVPCTIDPWEDNFDVYLSGVSDNCTPFDELEINYSQNLIPQNCSSDYVLIVNRTWTITDASNNSATCDQIIRFTRPDLNDIIFPEDDTLYCPNIDTMPEVTGFPTIDSLDIPLLCGLMVWKTDYISPNCGGTFTITRTWNVMDWCRGLQEMDVQNIVVLDTTGPVITCPGTVEINTAFEQCFGVYNIPQPATEDDCSSPGDLDFFYYVNGVFESDPNGVELPLGENEIRIVVFDGCGNDSECTYTVVVNDVQDPTIICFQDIVGLPGSGEAILSPSSFLDFEYRDNCAVVDTSIRRMTDNCGQADDLSFGPSITVCCEDVGDTIMVELMAVDEAGNSARCMFEMIVQDKLDPIVECPADVTVNCDQFSTDLSAYGPVSITDNCSFTVDSSESVNLNACKEGTATRTWIVTDIGGNVASCTQTITIVNPYNFDTTSITWPADTMLSACNMNGLDPFDIGSFPTFTQTPCETIGLDYSDMTMDQDSACLDIMRTWVIYDSCENRAFEYVQMVKIINNAPPVLTVPADVTLFADDECQDSVALPAAITNECSSGVVFENSYSSQGAVVDTTFELGETTIIYTATDECNNVSTDVTVVTVLDTTAPVINCPMDIVIGNDPDSCGALVNIAIPFTDDNCSIDSVVNTYTGTADATAYYPVGTTNIIYTVYDGSGNSASCSFSVTVEDEQAPDLTCQTDTVELFLDSICNAMIPDLTSTVSVTENCPASITITQDILPGQTFMMVQDTVVEIIATDIAGNSDTCYIPVSFIDTLPPNIICPDNDTVFVGSQCEHILQDYRGQAMVMSNCTDTMNVVIQQNPAPGDTVYGSGNLISVELTAFDASGNMMSCTFTVLLQDSISPFVSTLNDLSVPNDVDSCSAFVLLSLPDTSDNCGIVSITNSYNNNGLNASDQYPVGTTEVIFTVTDAAGNSSTSSFEVTVEDTQAPDLSIPTDITFDCLEGDTTFATATDNCDADPQITFSDVVVLDSCGLGSINRTWVATDSAGNSSSDIQVITIQDTTAPVINLPADTTFDCVPGISGTATATDNCSAQVRIDFSDSEDLDSCGLGTITRTWTATDCAGNVSTGNQVITLQDTTAPILDLPADITFDCIVGNVGMASATDNCDNQVSIAFTDFESIDSCGLGTIIRTWTATDCAGNVSSGEQMITVQDTVAPILGIPLDVTFDCLEGDTTFAQATDNCDVNPSVTFTDLSNLDSCGLGTITRTWIATDCAGNMSSDIQIITIQDTAAPALTIPVDITFDCLEGNAGIATAIDDCDNSVSISFTDLEDIDSCGLGTISRNWVATDCSGNITSAVQLITIQDTTAPVLILPADTVFDCIAGDAGMATATDDCDNSVSISFTDFENLDTCGLGTISRNWVATDCSGNVTSGVQTITIQDTVAPTITCPMDTIIALDSLCNGEIPAFAAVATDNCTDANDIQFFQTPPAGTVFNGPDTIVVTITAEDCAGNSSSCTLEVVFEDQTPPALVCLNQDTTYVNEECFVLVDDYTLLAVATDNCATLGTISFNQSPAPGDTLFVADTTIFVEIVASDPSGNMDTCMIPVFVADTIPPMISCPDDITLYLDTLCEATIPDLTGQVLLEDNCDPSISLMATQTPPGGTIVNGEDTITLVFEYVDGVDTVTCTSSVFVVDTISPSIMCPPDSIVFVGGDCEIMVPDFTSTTTVSDNCSQVDSISITQVPPPGSIFIYQSQEPGDYEVELIATDQNGNSTTCIVNLISQDTTAPVLECSGATLDLFLDENCASTIPDVTAEILSLTDNCTDSSFITIEQIPASGSQVVDTGSVSITIRATDASGNMDSCVITVNYSDTIAPTLQCPADTTVDCTVEFDMADLSMFGNATASDACGTVILTDTAEFFGLPSCKTDSIIRTFTAIDESGNISVCTQVIVFDGSSIVLTAGDFIFQDSVTITSCDVLEPFGPNSGAPVLDSNLLICNVIGYEVEDSIIGSNIGCFAIDRVYTVTDSCHFDPLTGAGQFTFEQIITVIDTTGPTITAPFLDSVIYQDSCGPVEIVVPAATVFDCAGIDTVFNNSPFANSTAGADISGVYEQGIYEFSIFAIDSCGNLDSVNINLTVNDTFPNEFTCIFKIIKDLDPNTLTAVFFASEFAESFVDSCGNEPLEDFSFSFSDMDPVDSVLVIDCDSIASTQDPQEYVVNYYLYVWLEGMVVDSCFIEVAAVDRNGDCPNTLVGGAVSSIQGNPMNGVAVLLDDQNSIIVDETDEEGRYAFFNRSGNDFIKIDAYYDTHPLQGVSTFDILLIMQHILQLSPIENPYYLIAADVDQSRTISGADIVHLRKALLRLTDDLPHDNWRFVSSYYEFNDASRAHSEMYDESIYLDDMMQDVTHADFTAIKVGDIDGSVEPWIRGRSGSDEVLMRREGNLIHFIAGKSDLLHGFQFDLSTQEGRLTGVSAGKVPLTLEDYTQTESGHLIISWVDAYGLNIKEGDILFSLQVADRFTEPSCAEEFLSSEIYWNQSGIPESIQLRWDVEQSAEWALHQNSPNPWKDVTRILFEAPSKGIVDLTIRDAAGRMILSQKISAEIGNNAIELNRRQLPGAGLYYYTLEGDQFSASKTMIVTE
jgi:hypothetical protein